MDKTPEQLQEIIKWYAQWLLNDAYEPVSIIEFLCDNLKPEALEIIVATYESNNK